jgi:PKD repeat protein
VVSPSHTYASGGTFSVTLTVYDGGSLSNSVTKQVTVTAPPPNDLPPTAKFTYNCIGLLPRQCAFDASTSSDDVGIVSYKWDWGNGRSETRTTPTAKNTWQTAGVYTVTLTVTDGGALSNSTSQQVTVGTVNPPPNQAPVAQFGSTCTNLACTFDSSGSTDDVGITNRAWTFGDGSSAGNVVSPSHTYASGGTFSVTLTVYDGGSLSNSVMKQVTVTASQPPPNQPPTANFASTCNALACGFTNTSTDADGTIASSSWTFGDGATSTATSPSHSYSAGGTYSVSLTVKDDQNASGSTTKSVTVTAPPPPPPISLTARGSKVKGVQQVDLSWTGATTSTVDLYRGGVIIANPLNSTTTQSGSYHDNLNRKGSATYQYKVCEANSTTVCSAIATVVF